MRKGVIKKVVMTASLGSALFLSGQALASDLVVATCAFDATTGDLVVGFVSTSAGAVLPTEVVKGAPCLNAIKALKAAGCSREEIIDFIRGDDPDPGVRTGRRGRFAPLKPAEFLFAFTAFCP